MSKESCVHRLNPDGSENTKYVDLLEEDNKYPVKNLFVLVLLVQKIF